MDITNNTEHGLTQGDLQVYGQWSLGQRDGANHDDGELEEDGRAAGVGHGAAASEEGQ